MVLGASEIMVPALPPLRLAGTCSLMIQFEVASRSWRKTVLDFKTGQSILKDLLHIKGQKKNLPSDFLKEMSLKREDQGLE